MCLFFYLSLVDLISNNQKRKSYFRLEVSFDNMNGQLLWTSQFALCSILLCLVAVACLMVGNRVNTVIMGTFCLSGKLSVDKLRLKLDNAMKKNDPDLLEKVIAECVGSGHVELMPDIQEARLHLESLEESGRGQFINVSLC